MDGPETLKHIKPTENKDLIGTMVESVWRDLQNAGPKKKREEEREIRRQV